jgi:hypothetical protein
MARFPDGLVLYFEYNGTCDVVIPALWPTAAAMEAHWRTDEGPQRCTCGQPPEPVTLWTSYGAGYYWPGTACLRCMCVVDGIGAYDIEQECGTPSWVLADRMQHRHPVPQ